MPAHSREDLLKVVEEYGWTVIQPRGKGYPKLHCPCGKHKKWMKKTPSDPNAYKNAIHFILRQECSKRD